MERGKPTYRKTDKPVRRRDSQGAVKLFVGGLTGDTTNLDLKQYFGQFANVVDAFVVYNSSRILG